MGNILGPSRGALYVSQENESYLVAQFQQEEAFLELLAKRFKLSGQEIPYAIFDIDDVLHLLCHRIVEDLGIDPARFLSTFSVRDNPLLTELEKKAVLTAFADAKYFQDIKFLPGVKRILEPQEYGAVTGVDSNAFSEKIGELKREQLLAAVPGLKPEQIKINVIHPGEAHKKVIDPRATILHDDSPFNVAMSPALLNSMPTWMPWSYSLEAVSQMTSKCVTWHDSLNQMIDFTCKAVQFMRK